MNKAIEELGERFIPWSDSITIRGQEERPHGFRLSTDCPACRVIEYFEERDSVVTHGVSFTGHAFADAFIQTLLPAETIVEPEVRWMGDMGITHLDAIVEFGPYAGHYEFKTSSDKNPKPSAAQRRQVYRQRAVMPARWAELDSYIIIIGKSGHLSGFIYGPFQVDPVESDVAATKRELATVESIIFDILENGVDVRAHPDLPALQRAGCYKCYPRSPEDVTGDLRELIDHEYHQFIEDYNTAKEWYDDIRGRIKGLVPAGPALLQTDLYEVVVSSNGAVRLKPKIAQS